MEGPKVRNCLNAKRSFVMVVLLFASPGIAGAEEFDKDPLLAEYQKVEEKLKGLTLSAKPSGDSLKDDRDAAKKAAQSAQRWALEGVARIKAASLVLRDFFSGPAEARERVSDSSAAESLPIGSRFVVEELRYEGHFKRPAPGSHGSYSAEKRPAWSDALLCQVVVFRDDEAGKRGMDYISVALFPKNRPGRKRPLRSSGPYERYRVTVANLGDLARVTTCERDAAFASDEYVADTTRERLMMHLYLLLDGSSKDVGARLPVGADNPVLGQAWTACVEAQPGPRLAEKGTLPGGPWRVSVLSSEQTAVSSAERFLLVFSYDMPKDTITVMSCTRDPEFAKKRDELNVVAAFAKKYLLSAAPYRRQVWSGSGKSRLPEEGRITIFGTLSFKKVVPVSGKTWKVECRIMHSGGFGRNVRHAVVFSCEIQERDDGRLTVVSDGLR